MVIAETIGRNSVFIYLVSAKEAKNMQALSNVQRGRCHRDAAVGKTAALRGIGPCQAEMRIAKA